MTRLLAAGLAGLLLGLLLGGVAAWRASSNSHAAELGREQQAAQADYTQTVDAGGAAVEQLQAKAGAIAANQASLEHELSESPHHVRTPLVLAPACRLAAGPRPRAADGVALGAGLAAASAPAAALPGPDRLADIAAPGPLDDPAVAADAGLQLSLGAVRMWNSALVGQPRAASLGADTCPADDPGAPACVAGAGRSVRDAWRNHTLNASLCAQDRAQLDELIALLRKRQAQSNELHHQGQP